VAVVVLFYGLLPWSTWKRGAAMFVRLLEHARSNAIAYVALCVSMLALAGGAYAAISLPANSVGAPQIHNHSIAPVKFNPSAIGGSVRHWAQVNAQGKIISSSSRALENGIPRDGGYLMSWSDKFSAKCIPVATVLGPSTILGPTPGFANARIVGGRPTRVLVTFNPQGSPAPAAFSVAVVC
jgi:hypothetical protein